MQTFLLFVFVLHQNKFILFISFSKDLPIVSGNKQKIRAVFLEALVPADTTPPCPSVFPAINTPGQRLCDSSHFSEASAFSQIREDPGRFLSASLVSIVFSSKSLICQRKHIWRWHCCPSYLLTLTNCPKPKFTDCVTVFLPPCPPVGFICLFLT